MMQQRTKDRYSDPQMRKIATINGKMYVLQEKAGLNKRQGLFIRKDWLDKLHLQAPKTLDDFYNVAKAFTLNDPDGNGKNDIYGFLRVDQLRRGLLFGGVWSEGRALIVQKRYLLDECHSTTGLLIVHLRMRSVEE